MIELFFWLIAIYVLVKAVRIFLKYFSPALKNPVQKSQQAKEETKYKEAEEVDFIEIKNDSKNGQEKS